MLTNYHAKKDFLANLRNKALQADAKIFEVKELEEVKLACPTFISSFLPLSFSLFLRPLLSSSLLLSPFIFLMLQLSLYIYVYVFLSSLFLSLYLTLLSPLSPIPFISYFFLWLSLWISLSAICFSTCTDCTNPPVGLQKSWIKTRPIMHSNSWLQESTWIQRSCCSDRCHLPWSVLLLLSFILSWWFEWLWLSSCMLLS